MASCEKHGGICHKIIGKVDPTKCWYCGKKITNGNKPKSEEPAVKHKKMTRKERITWRLRDIRIWALRLIASPAPDNRAVDLAGHEILKRTGELRELLKLDKED